jgi:hypothetical protein
VARDAILPAQRLSLIMANFGLLVVNVPDERLQEASALDYLQELDSIPAREIVLELQHVRDDLLPRVAAFVKYLGTRRPVRVCGLAPRQIDRLQLLGIEPDLLSVGQWSAGSRAAVR